MGAGCVTGRGPRVTRAPAPSCRRTSHRPARHRTACKDTSSSPVATRESGRAFRTRPPHARARCVLWTCVLDVRSGRPDTTRTCRRKHVRDTGSRTRGPIFTTPRQRPPMSARAVPPHPSRTRTAARRPPADAFRAVPRRPPEDPQQNRPDPVRRAFHPRLRRGTTIAGSPARARRRGGRGAAPGPPAGHRRRRPRGLRAPVAPGRPHRSTTGKNVTGLPLSAPRAHKDGALSRTRPIAIRRTSDLSPTDDVTIARRSLSRQSPVRRRRAGTRCDQQVDPLHERRTHLW